MFHIVQLPPLSEDTHQTPEIPTLALGVPALIVARNARYYPPLSSLPRDATPVAPPASPSTWLALTYPRRTLLLYATTRLYNPVTTVSPQHNILTQTLSDEFSPQLPREAYTFLRENADETADAFFNGKQLPPQKAQATLTAYQHTILPSLQPWVFTLCEDFFNWLSQPAS